VTVTERTKEIGVTKALGATRRSILIQFLTEAVAITMIGGILGIIFGVIIGNVVSYVVGETFIFPVLWVLLGLIVCFVTGVLSGLYPALKASALDPIEALRYE
jgi:putative ABC transport system permease protein